MRYRRILSKPASKQTAIISPFSLSPCAGYGGHHISASSHPPARSQRGGTGREAAEERGGPQWRSQVIWWGDGGRCRDQGLSFVLSRRDGWRFVLPHGRAASAGCCCYCYCCYCCGFSRWWVSISIAPTIDTAVGALIF